MTVEQIWALIVAINAVVLFINKTGMTKLISNNNKANKQEIEVVSAKHQKELAENKTELQQLKNEVIYYRSLRVQSLQERLELTNDEKERKEILDQLDTMANFR